MEKQAEVSSGGYDYQFVQTPLDMLICKICHFPSKEPCLSECCGHTFCGSCIDRAKKAFYPCICPVCRSEQFKLIRNKQNERIIKSLYVYCINKAEGCEWQGEINDVNGHLEHDDGCLYEKDACPNNCDKILQRKSLNDHLENECPRRKVSCYYCHITHEFQCIDDSHMEKCPKYPLPCPNNCGISDVPRDDVDDHREVCPLEKVGCPNDCEVFFQRKYLQNHIKNECPRRMVNCQYCHITDEFQYIECSHMENCPKFPLPCPNNCGISDIPREDMNNHREVCPLKKVECPKCETFLQQRCLQSHIDNECPCREVICQYCQTVEEQRFIEGEHVVLCPKFPLVCPNKCEAENILREDMETHKKKCPLEVIQCGYHNVGCKTKMARKDLQIHKQEKMEEHISFIMSELVSTRDKLAATEQQLVTNNKEASAAQTQLLEEFNSFKVQSQLKFNRLESQLQDAKEDMKWIFNIENRANCYRNQMFPVVIKVSEFERKKHNKDDWFSHFFFTHEKGYKMKLNVVPAGWNWCEGSHVSVSLYLMKGPNDHHLQWPMQKRIQVKLLNQQSDNYHHLHELVINAKRIMDESSNNVWNCPDFIHHEDLESTTIRQFLFNDSIYFEVDAI